MRAVVAHALATMDGDASERRWRTARHTVILLRMDVAKEDAAAVARDLGISERQLRRERRVAHRRLHSVLRCAARPATITVLDSSVQVQLERSERLADSGEAGSALAILDDVAARAADGAARCRALLRAADVETELHRLGAAGQRIDHAQRLVRDEIVPGFERPTLEGQLTRSQLQLAWYAKGPAEVDRAIGDARDCCEARLWLLRACAALRGGNGARARKFAGQARVTAAPTDVSLQIDLGILEAELCDYLDAEPERAEREFARLATFASEHGYGGRSLWLTHLHAYTRWLHSHTAVARNAYRALVDRIEPSLPKQQRLMLFFSAADIELAIGSPARAASAAEHALLLTTNPYERLTAQALLAGATLRRGDIAEAEHSAVSAAEEARLIGYLRVTSTSQRIAADAALRRGDRVLARERIEDALQCAQGRTSLYVLARTYDLAARITRERRHRQLARELRAAARL
ncbi:MAG: hypothetical protein JO043_00035 [Candidatus Eremiobacteraeota bacterium]|nr:hypothetical protein [Candidatus Eremiobacteraeota bacterium]